MKTKNVRFMELEGLRGIAAIAVVLAHYMLAFYPALISGNASLTHSSLEELIHGTPIALLYAGTFAVAIFFVLSGFVLSIGYFQTNDKSIVKRLAHSRYLRLMLPALASVVLAYLLISFGAGHMSAVAGEETKSWLFNSWLIDTSFLSTIQGGMFDIFVQSGSPLNTVLWTMYIEFLGSFLVFIFLLLFAQSRYRWTTYAMLIFFTFNSWFMPFVIGVLIADLYSKGRLEKLKKVWIIAPLLIGGLLLGSLPHKGIENTPYNVLFQVDIESLVGMADINYERLYLTIGAVMILLAVLLSRRLSAWLRQPRVAMLGRYTFSLYLTHLLVLLSFSSGLFALLPDSIGYNKTAVLTILLSIPIILIVTILFERYIDAPSIKFSKWVGAVYRGEKTFDWRSQLHPIVNILESLQEKFTKLYSRPESDELLD